MLWNDVFLALLLAFMAGVKTCEVSGGTLTLQDAPRWVPVVALVAMHAGGVQCLALGIWSLWFFHALRRQTVVDDSITALIRLYEVILPVWGTRRYWRLYGSATQPDAAEKEGPTNGSNDGWGLWAKIGGALLDLVFFCWPALVTAMGVRWLAAHGAVPYVSGDTFLGSMMMFYCFTDLACLLTVESYVQARWKRVAWFIPLVLFPPVGVPVFGFTILRPLAPDTDRG